MSTIVTETSAVTPQPTMPWQATTRKKVATLMSLVISAVVSFAIVLVTGLAGVDGFALTFFGVSFLAVAIRTFRLDSKKRKDAFVTVAIIATAVLAFSPWMSIFGSVIIKGLRGLRPNFLYETMQTTTPDDELSLGGAGHAIVGSAIMVVIATAITLPLGILSGVYLTEVRGRLTFLVRFVV
ncbi:MAG: hypothetical protein EBV40_04160, partial [Actinobacteria bacterium]|nr:hypothetical protein [Actinomycetota bacterium]